MKLKFSGIEYGFGCTNTVEVIVDINEDFAVKHDDDLTTIYHKNGWNNLQRETVKCEIVE